MQTPASSLRAAAFTFGVEIECLVPAGTFRIGQYHAGVEIGGDFPAGWNAQHDGSLSTARPGYIGVEVVSPVLSGPAGIAEMKKVAALLEARGAAVNPTCGFHVHVGAKSVAGQDFDHIAEWVRKLINQVAHHEKALYGASGTRRREASRFCRSVKDRWQPLAKTVLKKRHIKVDEMRINAGLDRYQLLNLQPLFYRDQATVEFRGFSGTTSGLKMAAWVQMVLALADRALDRDTSFDAPAVSYADGRSAFGALERFFYLVGWTRGRKDAGKPTCIACGWVEPIENIHDAKRELARLARKYDAGQ